MATISDLLSRYVERHPITDGDAGERLGVKGPTFQRWRTGGIIPTLTRAEALAEFLDLSETDVLSAILQSQRAHARGATTGARAPDRCDPIAAEIAELRARVEALEEQADAAELPRAAKAKGTTAPVKRQAKNRPLPE